MDDGSRVKQITLTAIGASVGNSGPSGWAYLLRYGLHSVECAGTSETPGDRDRMAIVAAIAGLEAIKEPCCEVLIVSDSIPLLNGATDWRFTGRDSGWMSKPKKRPESNVDLWQALYILTDKHLVLRGQWWIKSRPGQRDCERCADLAFEQASSFFKSIL